MEGELLVDWEIVNGSDTESTDSITSDKNWGSSRIIDDGMILSPHNLIDQSLESDLDYGSESLNPVDASDDACVRNELGLCDFEAAEENHAPSEAVTDDVTECLSETDHLHGTRHVEDQSGVEEPIEDLSKSWSSDSGGNQLVSGDSGIVNDQEEEIVSESEPLEESGENTVAVDSAASSGDESKSRETVWWKMPFVLVKYSAFRIGPLWSVSMAAAALMGFLLLGRRLYNIKNKPQRIHLKVAIDYKKVSRVMNQAARLNEAFTEVRRVPVIRPALPAPGTWPVLSLR